MKETSLKTRFMNFISFDVIVKDCHLQHYKCKNNAYNWGKLNNYYVIGK